MRFKLLSMLAAVLLLAACGSEPEETATVDGAGGGAGQFGGLAPASPMGQGTPQDFAQNVGDRVYFDFDRSDLSPEARATLDRQAEWLRQFANFRVSIEGHADERGTREYNLALGERRASAVRNYLIALGIDGSRVNTLSYGKERPDVLGSDESAWARNRRAVTVLN